MWPYYETFWQKPSRQKLLTLSMLHKSFNLNFTFQWDFSKQFGAKNAGCSLIFRLINVFLVIPSTWGIKMPRYKQIKIISFAFMEEECTPLCKYQQ